MPLSTTISLANSDCLNLSGNGHFGFEKAPIDVAKTIDEINRFSNQFVTSTEAQRSGEICGSPASLDAQPTGTNKFVISTEA